jgi:hypothetical protein
MRIHPQGALVQATLQFHAIVYFHTLRYYDEPQEVNRFHAESMFAKFRI